MQDKIISLYQQYCHYKINCGVQELDIPIDFDQVYKEITEFIVKNNFGFNSVSLRLPQPSNNNQDYLNSIEGVRNTALEIDPFRFINKTKNTIQDAEYKFWHPQLENSYTKELLTSIENYSGFNIGRVRLAWLHSNEEYPMHVDLEPMRFHIPIVTNKYCYFIEDHKLYHMRQNHIYHILTSSTHMAGNYGKLPRLHLIYSTHFPEKFNDEITQLFDQTMLDQMFYDHLDDIDPKSLQFLTALTAIEEDLVLSNNTRGIIKYLFNKKKY